jgi:hypothetical protein
VSIDTLLDEAQAEGFLLNKVYGFADTTWHAEFAYLGKRCGFGQGDSLPEAIAQALVLARLHKDQLRRDVCVSQ